MLFDTHTHVASPDTGRHPFTPTGVGSDWWQTPGYDTAHLLETTERNGVDRCLVVQPVGAYAYDNRFLLETVAGQTDRLAAVPALDPEAPDPGVAVAEMAEHPEVVAVRLFAVADPVSGRGWTDTGRVAAALSAAASTGTPVSLAAFPHQLTELRQVIEEHPHVPVVLEHCGFCELADGRIPDDAPLLTFAATPQVAVKVTSLVLVDTPTPDVLVGQLAETFGPSRLQWGSDYPQTDVGEYAAAVRLLDDALRGLPAPDREAPRGANAAALYLGARH